MRKIKVMVVDDSAVVRQVISGALARERSIEVLAAVADPIFAMQRMRSHWPDVIVLDVEMPRMDGITFLRKIMTERPTPVVICSTLTVAVFGCRTIAGVTPVNRWRSLQALKSATGFGGVA